METDLCGICGLMLIRISSRGIGDRGKQAFSLGTLRHQDIDLELVQRAQKKVDKYRGGYQAHGLRHAFMPANCLRVRTHPRGTA